jgi:tetratricopeptide (TPR) repeat protein
VACIDEDTFAAYFALKLSPEQTAELFDHVDVCSACAKLFDEGARFIARDSDGSSHDLGTTRTFDAGLDETGTGRPLAATSRPLATVGRYQIDRVLGMGGMGVVYAAHDPELDRPVAVKVLRPDMLASVETVRVRLTREAQAMARLSHPNVINVYEIGTHGQQVFIVMELIRGTTMTAWLRERPRSWREIVRAFVAAGEGLAAAHEAGLVHRDFKPDNVLISTSGRICVTDFGLARLGDSKEEAGSSSSPSPGGAPTLTYSGRLVGTPAYMAPEQMRGESTDARADVFSFCVALYEALYETRPFAATDLDALAAEIANGRINPPRRLIGPHSYRRAIERGLAARPEARPASLAELLALLRVDPIARRWRVLLSASAFLLAVTAGAGIMHLQRRSLLCSGGAQQLAGVWDDGRRSVVHAAFTASGKPYAETAWQRTVAALDDYARRWSSMHTEACEATRIRGDQSEEMLDLRNICLADRRAGLAALVTVLSERGGAAVEKSVAAAQSLAPLDGCADIRALRMRVPPPKDPANRVRFDRLTQRITEIEQLTNAGERSRARDLVDGVLAEATALDHPSLLARALIAEGMLRSYLDQSPSEDWYHRAAAEALRGGDEELAALAWERLALFLAGRRDDRADARRWASYVAALLAHSGDASVSAQASYAFFLGQITYWDGSTENLKPWEQAAAHYQRAAILFGQSGQLAKQADALAQAGHHLAYCGKLDEAASLCQRARDLAIANFGARHPAVEAPLNCLSDVNLARMQYGEALESNRELLAIDEAIYGPETTYVAADSLFVGEVLLELGRAEDALAAITRAERLLEQHPHDRPPQLPSGLARSLVAEGEALEQLGRWQDALVVLERASGLSHQLDDDNLAELDFAHARALWNGSSQRGRACQLANRALDMFRKLQPVPFNRDRVVQIERWLAQRS